MAVSPPLPTELRLALAMRGGVSLAVWMGGACREVAAVRNREGTYADLLKVCGYTDGVVVDVLAGTSAGGLNGVLLGQHIVCGSRFDSGVRDLWLQVGDLEGLTRSPKQKDPPSLLLGDGETGFFGRLAAAMRHLARTKEEAAAAGQPRATHPLRLLITATRLDARPDALFPATGTAMFVGTNRAFFRFRSAGNAVAGFDDFTTERAIERLAYAARTTSSFPAAFEPATPYVKWPPRTGPTDPGAPVNMHGVSSETARPDSDRGQVELMDGGVLDNIPLAWAVRAIAGMPAQRPVDRWLVYLQPVSAAPPSVTESTSPGVRRIAKLLRTMGSVKTSSESVLDDGRELHDAANAAAAADGILRSALPTELTALTAAADAGFETYRLAAGLAEAARLRTLLTDPLSTIGPDPLPVPRETFPLQRLAHSSEPLTDDVKPLRPLAPGTASLLVAPAGEPWTAVGTAAYSPLVAARAVTLLLHVVRQAETASPGADYTDLRIQLYALRFACEVTVAARDRALLSVTYADPARAPEALLGHASTTLRPWLPPAPAAGADAGAWGEWASGVAKAVAQTEQDTTQAEREAGRANPGSAPKPPKTKPVSHPFEENIYAPLWEGLVTATLNLAGQLPGSPAILTPAGEALRRATSPEAASQILAALEILTGALRPDPLLSPSCPRLAVASATNVSPLERFIFDRELSAGDRVERKLSGNQIMNFAAFLSSRWRENDWLWGRLDGAQTLVQIIAREDRLPVDLTAEDVRGLFIGTTDGEWRNFLESQWANYAELAENAPRTALCLAAVERLQWDILAEELPLLEVLGERYNGQDRPPTRAELDKGKPAVPPAKPSNTSLRRFGAVGDETVIGLLPRSDLRRTVMRLGLVGWRAMLPAGPAGVALRWSLAPTVFLPVLLALVAPVASISCAIAMWAATAVATGRWGSGVQIPIALGLAPACAVLVWRLQATQRGGSAMAGGEKKRAWLAPLLAALAALIVAADALVLTWSQRLCPGIAPPATAPPGQCLHTRGWHIEPGAWTRLWMVAALVTLAVIVPLAYTVTETGLRGFARTRHLVAGWQRRARHVLLWALFTGGGAGAAAALLGPRPIGGLAVLYLSLLGSLIAVRRLLVDAPPSVVQESST